MNHFRSIAATLAVLGTGAALGLSGCEKNQSSTNSPDEGAAPAAEAPAEGEASCGAGKGDDAEASCGGEKAHEDGAHEETSEEEDAPEGEASCGATP